MLDSKNKPLKTRMVQGIISYQGLTKVFLKATEKVKIDGYQKEN